MTVAPRRHWDAPLYPYITVDLDSGVFGFLLEILESKQNVHGRYSPEYDDMIKRGVESFQHALSARIVEAEATVANRNIRKVARRTVAKPSRKR